MHCFSSYAAPLGGLYLQQRSKKNHRAFRWRVVIRRGAVSQVNIHLFIETRPFGGVGSSGMGHYYGKYGFDQLTHAKSMLISPPDVAIDHLFPRYTEEKVRALSMWFDY